MAEILNAAPMVIDNGTRDLSTRVVPSSPLEIPQHLPKFYIFAEKGPMGPNYMDLGNASLTQIYGDATFDVNDKYYSHQTPFLQAAASAGNNCVVHRLPGDKGSDVANVTLYLDVLRTQVPLYEKNIDGSLRLDHNDEPVRQRDNNGDLMTLPGFKLGWVLGSTREYPGDYQPGTRSVEPGVQYEFESQSTQYPIFEFSAADAGEFGNKLAIKLFAGQESDTSGFPSAILNDGKMFPMYFGMSKVVDKITGKSASVLNSFGAQFSRFLPKVKGVDPQSGAIADLSKVLKDQYIQLPAELASGLGSVYVYEDNLVSLLTEFYEREMNITDPHRDSVINNSEENVFAINFLSFVSSNGSPYQSMKLVDVEGGVRLTKNTNLWLGGAHDGDMSTWLMNSLVIADMDNYNNALHEYNDLVLHPESIIYDSGFSLAAKKALAKFISRRKDTFVVLSTFEQPYADPGANLQSGMSGGAPESGYPQTLGEQYSVGVALKTMMELYPESATFGTPVMRGMVIGGSGEIINSLYTPRVPVTYEVVHKAARYMGAKNGAWKNGFLFDRAPQSVVTQLKNIDVTWVPASARNTLWSVGVNFVLNYKIRTQFFPALQTVYENDTSVLNSFFTAVAISYLNKVQHAAWREFSGSISLTNAQLEEAVNTFIANNVKDKFDGKFVVVPDTVVTELDEIRGYSWTSNIKIYANNMKTVMTAMVEAYRMSDLAE